jgi:hypothetical protein
LKLPNSYKKHLDRQTATKSITWGFKQFVAGVTLTTQNQAKENPWSPEPTGLFEQFSLFHWLEQVWAGWTGTDRFPYD